MKLKNFYSAGAVSFFILLSSSPAVLAQPHVLLKAGVNFSSWLGQVGEVASDKTSFHVGGQFQIPLGGGAFLQPELEYSSEGATVPELGLSVSLNYLNFPIVVRWSEPSSPNFFYDFGVLYGHLLNAKGSIHNLRGDFKKLYNSSDFAVVGGLGYQSPKGFGFAARYNFGLAKVWINSDLPGGNGVLQFSLFYKISKSKKK